jgi:hypothetical protein
MSKWKARTVRLEDRHNVNQKGSATLLSGGSEDQVTISKKNGLMLLDLTQMIEFRGLIDMVGSRAPLKVGIFHFLA